MIMQITKGTAGDQEELSALYDDLIDHLEATVNYPGWRKGIYPTAETARAGISEGTLFVARERADGPIAGTVVLNHLPEEAYGGEPWGIDCPEEEAVVIHTLALHPDWLGHGVGQALMDFAAQHARQTGAVTVRLDVSEHNAPAIALYERCGYRRVSKVNLGLPYEHLKWFYLYELVL